MTIDYEGVGKRVKAARKKMGLTQQQLAEITHLEPNHISHIERGLSKGSIQSLASIANALNTTIDALIADSLPTEKNYYLGNISELLEDCTPQELRVVEDTIKTLVTSLRKQYPLQEKNE